MCTDFWDYWLPNAHVDCIIIGINSYDSRVQLFFLLCESREVLDIIRMVALDCKCRLFSICEDD